MPVYIVTGKLGSGKTLAMVGRMRDYLESGRPVATNVQLDLRKLCARRPGANVTRLPDRPALVDLLSIGAVHSTGLEELNGALVLDECGTFLNSRQWGDKGRQGFIDWLLHSRKLGWDVFLIVQNASLIDKQIRDAMAEYVVTCRRLDRIRVPFLGRFLSVLTAGMYKGQMPKVHVATVTYGTGHGGIWADTWWYAGAKLYPAYQTVQVMGDESPGVHSLTWYETSAELAQRLASRRILKPKLNAINIAAGLGRDEAWNVARRYVQALGASSRPQATSP